MDLSTAVSNVIFYETAPPHGDAHQPHAFGQRRFEVAVTADAADRPARRKERITRLGPPCGEAHYPLGVVDVQHRCPSFSAPHVVAVRINVLHTKVDEEPDASLFGSIFRNKTNACDNRRFCIHSIHSHAFIGRSTMSSTMHMRLPLAVVRVKSSWSIGPCRFSARSTHATVRRGSTKGGVMKHV